MLRKLDSGGALTVSVGIGLDCLGCLSLRVPFSISKVPLLISGRTASLLISVVEKGFRGGPLLDYVGCMQLLVSSHVGDRDKALWGSLEWFSPWNGARGKRSLSFFVVGLMGMGICFGSVRSPLWFVLACFRATSQRPVTSGLRPRASRSSSRTGGTSGQKQRTDPRTGIFIQESLGYAARQVFRGVPVLPQRFLLLPLPVLSLVSAQSSEDLTVAQVEIMGVR